jgi:excisionase family DNA binding protein
VGEDATGRPSGRRVTVDEAARRLGLTVDAVRKRVQRGQIPHEKDGAGRVRIILDESETLRDEGPDRRSPASLVEELRDRIAYLERQVEEEREARRRADTILAQLSQANAEQARTIRAIEAPGFAGGATEAREDAPESPGPGFATRTADEGTETATERPWWRFWGS